MLAMAAITVSAETFSLTDTSGKLHSLAAYRGKWVMVNVWATWCAPSFTEMPKLEALQQGPSGHGGDWTGCRRRKSATRNQVRQGAASELSDRNRRRRR
ncbi:MAG: TlpA family protein disulfide reductase [Bdellovibrionales bacterium]|nr:TlpA family protein disulfide reductase [Massilia sp.]